MAWISWISVIFFNLYNLDEFPYITAQYIFINKMSQAEIDSILKKYDRSVQKPRYDVMHT